MRRPVVLAALTAFAVRALIVAKLPAPAVWDGAIYAQLARHLANGHGFAAWAHTAAPWPPTAFFPVGYPALLAAALALGAELPRAAHIVNVLAGTLSAACAAAIGYRLADTRGAYFSGLACALAPGPALFCAATMTESVTGALLALAVTVSVTPVSATRARLTTSAAAGTLIGLSALVRPQMILAAPFVGAIPPAKRSIRVLGTVVAVIASLGVVLPWTARNCTVMHGCALVSTNGGSNLLIGTFVDAQGGYRAPGPADGCDAVRGESASDRCMTREAIRRIAHDPLTWTRLGLIKLARTFALEWTPVSYLRSSMPGTFPGASASRAAVICSAYWWAIGLAAVVGGRRAMRAGGRLAAIASIVGLNVLLVALTHFVFLGDDRYHLPLVPILAGLAAGVFLPSRPQREAEMVWAH